MQSNPHKFNLQRIQKNKTGGIIKSRVDQIILYVIDCYLYMLENPPQYSISKIGKTTTYKFEEYLTSELVENYLNRQISSLNQSQINQILFTTEATRKYTDSKDQKEKPDKIDIYISNLNLDKELSSNSQPYFAIECKRIRKSDSINEYISDIIKFSDRIHNQTRLPFEGQIAFIESPLYPHNVTVDNINIKLQSCKTIKTMQFLEFSLIHQNFNGSYYSKHFRNFGENNVFAIYHLMFDYTKIVID